MGRSLQEPAEPLGAVAVEAPLAERRRREDGIEVGIECIDRRGRQNVRDDAIAAFDQPGGQFFGRHICHSTNSCWPNSANVSGSKTPPRFWPSIVTASNCIWRDASVLPSLGKGPPK